MAIQVVLAGNPNVGKSTVFNALTGLRQHTGNWTGKTVAPARGRWTLEGVTYEAVDLPGVYSLAGGTPEERVAADYLAAHRPDVLVVVLDATALERTLGLALELRARCDRLLLCLNLTDEAARLGRKLDPQALSAALRAPVVETRADRPKSYEQLRQAIAHFGAFPACRDCTEMPTIPRPTPAELAEAVTLSKGRPRRDWDRLLLGRRTAWPLTLALLFGLFYLTVRGANYPSALLEAGLDRLGAALARLPLPPTLGSLLLDGIYATTAKVVSVMLPPMAIFFPLFSLLEDLGLLPRLALLLDRPFAACGACGRQGLCMCMGCGCNAVGVTGCRIISNEKERLAAVLTNALTPCNGRFPTLIVLAELMLSRAGGLSALATAAVLTGCIGLSALVTLAATALLRRTLLRGEEGSFVLELPPLRRPRVRQVLIRSVLDRTLRVLGRAVTVAAPAGALLWLLSRLTLGGEPLLLALARALEPAASVLGLTGTLLLAFILSFPANELLLPLTLRIGFLGAAQAVPTLGTAALLAQLGVTPGVALCAAVFTLFHWPCSTTVLTVWHETKSLKWTALSVLLPTLIGGSLCALLHAVWSILA